MFFGKSRKKERTAYDKTGKVPVIRSSICTGEKVAGFKDKKDFMLRYGVKEEEIRKEW